MTATMAAELVRQERRGSVLVLALSAPPVNVLGPALRQALQAGLLAAEQADVAAVVIASDLPQFSAGMEAGADQPGVASLADLCGQIETLAKPVVVALNGSVLGGGLDLALAAHARVAAETARLGCPEVSLGRVPEGGATQRLPRLIGAEAALRLLCEPGPVSAAVAMAQGLVDLVVAPGEVRAMACTLAQQLADELAGRPPFPTSARRDGFRDPRAYQAAVAAARGKHVLAHLPAAGRAIDCVEAALLLPWEQGLAFEAQAFAELAQSDQARGLRHAQAAEQRALQPPRLAAAGVMPDLARLAIWGAGELSAEVALQALGRGMRVILVEPQREALVKTVELIAARQDLAVTEGRMTEAAREADWARLGSTLAPTGLAGADLVVLAPDAPALPEGVAVPVLPLGALPLRAAPGKLGLQPAVAAGLPAELAMTDGVDPQAVQRAMALARRLGWRLVFAGPGGPIDRRLRAAMAAAIAGLESAGLARPVISAALASFGIGLAPRAALPKPPPEAPEVLEACLTALVNQGARMLSEGVALRAGDIDAVAVMSGLFPRWQGGPMHWADQRGLLVLRAELRHRAEAAPLIYTPDPLIDQMISQGLRFADI